MPRLPPTGRRTRRRGSRFSVIAVAFELGHDAGRRRMTSTRWARPMISSSSEEMSRIAVPARRELDEEVVDRALRADVDAARRLVGDDDARLAEQHPREEHLLLVAAGERLDRSRVARAAHAAPLEHAARRLPLAPFGGRRRATLSAPSRGSVVFSIDERPKMQALVLPRLGDHRDARAEAPARAAAEPRRRSPARPRPPRRAPRRRSSARARCARRRRGRPARGSRRRAARSSRPRRRARAGRAPRARPARRRPAAAFGGNVAVSGRPSIASTSDASVSVARSAPSSRSGRRAAP